MVGKCFLESVVGFGVDMAVICEEILTNATIGVDLASDIALIGGVLVANEADVSATLYYSADITTNTVVHLSALGDNILSTSGNGYYIVAIGKLPRFAMLGIVLGNSLVVKFDFAEFVFLFGFAILSHKVVFFTRCLFHTSAH
jgi:hypothetical protein